MFRAALATQAQDVGPSAPTRSVASYSCPEQDCVKMYQKHLDGGHHLVKKERESDYDSL